MKPHPLLGKVSDAYWSGRMIISLQWVYEGPAGFEPLSGLTMFFYYYFLLAAGALQGPSVAFLWDEEVFVVVESIMVLS